MECVVSSQNYKHLVCVAADWKAEVMDGLLQEIVLFLWFGSETGDFHDPINLSCFFRTKTILDRQAEAQRQAWLGLQGFKDKGRVLYSLTPLTIFYLHSQTKWPNSVG